jgi:hypothetical protein
VALVELATHWCTKEFARAPASADEYVQADVIAAETAPAPRNGQ